MQTKKRFLKGGVSLPARRARHNKKCKQKKVRFFCQPWFDPLDPTIVRSGGSNHGSILRIEQLFDPEDRTMDRKSLPARRARQQVCIFCFKKVFFLFTFFVSNILFVRKTFPALFFFLKAVVSLPARRARHQKKECLNLSL